MSDFEDLVADALDGLPPSFAAAMDNVVVVVSDEPNADDLASVGLEPGDELYGLYRGVPQTERTGAYTFTLPDQITIFRGPLVRRYRTPEEITQQVRRTVIHEIAHHFGIGDDRLDELGWA